MSDRRRSKVKVLLVAVCLAVVLGSLLIASTTPAKAVVALEYLVICHLKVQTGEYSQVGSPGAVNGHTSHKEDLVLPPLSVCPDKVASPSR